MRIYQKLATETQVKPDVNNFFHGFDATLKDVYLDFDVCIKPEKRKNFLLTFIFDDNSLIQVCVEAVFFNSIDIELKNTEGTVSEVESFLSSLRTWLFRTA